MASSRNSPDTHTLRWTSMTPAGVPISLRGFHHAFNVCLFDAYGSVLLWWRLKKPRPITGQKQECRETAALDISSTVEYGGDQIYSNFP
jgi:hypothetical protein